MRVYFLSAQAGILKLNGLYAGGIDLFERHMEVDLSDNLLAEIVPGDNLQPLNFFLNEGLLSDPPDFLDVYVMANELLIYARTFAAKSRAPEVIFQSRFGQNLITVFLQGEIYLSVEGTQYILKPLGGKFKSLNAEEKLLAGRRVFAIYGANALAIISESGKLVFLNEVESAHFGDDLRVKIAFDTCTGSFAECTYSFDGEGLTLISSVTRDAFPPDKRILHFAFFESVLTCGNFEEYLSPALKEKASDLKGYLGEYTGVSVPTERFYAEHPNALAAGLIYPKKSNLYEVKYYAVDIVDGKIDNIYPL